MMTKRISGVFGVLFLMLATLGTCRPDSVLGLFSADARVCAVFLAVGALGVVAALSGAYVTRLYLWTAGLFFLATSVAGFLAGHVMGVELAQADNFLGLGSAAAALFAVFGEDPHSADEFIPITGRRGVTDFRQSAHRW